VVDRDAILDLVDQLRVAIPEEVRAAKRINAEGERIIERAEDEAAQIVSRAQEQAAFLIGDRGLLELAESEGRRIISTAEADAEEVRAGADDYAFALLETLESEVGKALVGVQRGISVLAERRDELGASAAAAAATTDGQPIDDGAYADDGSYIDESEDEDIAGEDEDEERPGYR
jgi:hypothetical protein